jgi:hypothetical protein
VRYGLNKERMMRLSEYSRDSLRELRAETGIAYEQRSRGTLQLFRSAAQVEDAARDIRVLEECGVPFELLDRDGVARAEPALAPILMQMCGGKIDQPVPGSVITHQMQTITNELITPDAIYRTNPIIALAILNNMFRCKGAQHLRSSRGQIYFLYAMTTGEQGCAMLRKGYSHVPGLIMWNIPDLKCAVVKPVKTICTDTSNYPGVICFQRPQPVYACSIETSALNFLQPTGSEQTSKE